jgi:hypothetical protein
VTLDHYCGCLMYELSVLSANNIIFKPKLEVLGFFLRTTVVRRSNSSTRTIILVPDSVQVQVHTRHV